MLAAAAVYCLFPASSRHPSKEGDTGQWLPLLPCSASCGRSRYSGTVGVKCLKKSFELELILMAGEGINEDYPVEIHEYLSAFENSIGAVDEMLKTMMSVSRNELLQKLDPLEQAKVDLVSAYTLNSMFWVYLATQGVNPKEHPVKQELERIRVYMNRVKEITDKKKAGKLDRGAASRFVKNALWEPKPKNASKVANKGKSKN